MNAVAFDISAACSGFLYAMKISNQMISDGAFENALIIGAEKLSAFVNWEDRTTCVLFGDGAGAAEIEDAELAALAEEVGFQRVVIAEFEGSGSGDGAADDGAVEVGVNEADLAGDEKFVEKKRSAEFFRIENGSLAGRWHESSFHDVNYVLPAIVGDHLPIK